MIRSPQIWSLIFSVLMILIGGMMGNNNDNKGIIVVSAMEATWTPNEDDGPAMPLSMNQRQQLVQLQQAIQNAPDPSGTLEQVAESNGMSANDLYQMIEKNAQDLQQDPQLLSELQSFASQSSTGNSLPKIIFRIVASLGIAIRQIAKQNPRTFTMTALIGLLMFYSLLAIPRTGIHISSGRSLLLSRGPTTVFAPPDRYVHKLIGKTAYASMKKSSPPRLSIQTLKKDWDDLLIPMRRELIATGLNENDGDENDDNAMTLNGKVEVHKLSRKNELRQAVTAQFVLSPDKLLEEFPLGETKEEIIAERDTIVDMLYTNAVNILSERNILEFSSLNSKQRLRNICGDGSDDTDKDLGVIVVPGLGNFGRHGLVYWMATSQTTQQSATSPSSSSTLTLTTLKGKGYFDGQIHIDVNKIPNHDGMLLVQVSLAVPKGGRKIPKKIGERLVEEMARSIIQSSSRKSQQRLARQSQGKRFKESGNRRANDKRNTRFDRERLMEEMAVDRRRRWQKKNPDAGRYRPSGDRMRSPHNC